MAKEIERKFLVVNDSYKTMAKSHKKIEQAYLCREPRSTVRVRVADNKAFITVKGLNDGAVRDEWEWEIGVFDAKDMIKACATGRMVVKTRYFVDFKGMMWEVDEFGGDLQGLVVAEIELPSGDAEFALPPFVGEEVTGDARYYNSML